MTRNQFSSVFPRPLLLESFLNPVLTAGLNTPPILINKLYCDFCLHLFISPTKTGFLVARGYTSFQTCSVISHLFLEPVTLGTIVVATVHREIVLRKDQEQFISWSNMKSRVEGSWCVSDDVLGAGGMSACETWRWHSDSDGRIYSRTVRVAGWGVRSFRL